MAPSFQGYLIGANIQTRSIIRKYLQLLYNRRIAVIKTIDLLVPVYLTY